MELSELTAQARKATEELLEAAHLETGDVFVVGCSSSEIRGGRIGHDSSMEVAAAWRCDSPSHTSAGTITVPPPMPNMPDNRPTIMPTITSTIMP